MSRLLSQCRVFEKYVVTELNSFSEALTSRIARRVASVPGSKVEGTALAQSANALGPALSSSAGLLLEEQRMACTDMGSEGDSESGLGGCPSQYERRSANLAVRMAERVRQLAKEPISILDVGAGNGFVDSELQRLLHQRIIATNRYSELKPDLLGSLEYIVSDGAHLPFRSGAFTVVLFTSVYEHLPPAMRGPTMAEIYRVLASGGLLIGQIPNMNFPVEPHSQIPLLQFMPHRVQPWLYQHFSRVESPEFRRQGISWFRVTMGQLQADARKAGFSEGTIVHAAYDPGIFPRFLRPALPALKIIPLGYDFWFAKH